MKSHQQHINERLLADERAAERILAASLGIWTIVLALGLAVFLGAALAAFDQINDVLQQAHDLRGY
ncbi:hypothetical protein [Microcystis phage Mae-JY02]